MIRNFDDLIDMASKIKSKSKVAVAAAHDSHTLEALSLAYRDGLIEPILIGYENKIRQIIMDEDLPFGKVTIINAEDEKTCAELAVKMTRDGKTNSIMKGKLQTADLLREVLNSEYGLKRGELMSHVGLFGMPSYHKLITITDGGMVPHPDLRQKRYILDNALHTLKLLGYTMPKVAALSASELVSQKISESTHGAELKEMNQGGIINDCIIEGPISYDLAMDKDIAEAKGYENSVAGDADVLLAPSMAAGNILAKALIASAGARMAGIIVGATAPIIVVSRGASTEEKYLSLVLAAVTGKGI